MKSLLKLLGTLALATTPVVTVVACGSENNQMTPRDILNFAASFITDSNLKIKDDLNLSDDTNIGEMKGKIFSELDTSVQTAIGNFFSSKLKESTNEHPTNWYHPDAHVKIMDYVPKKDNDNDEKDKPKFVLPTGSELVNGHLWVKAEISYLNLPSVTKDIKITISNDTSHTSDQKKADAIRDFINEEITKGNLNINVENLPIDGKIDGPSKEDISRTQLSYIKQNLNVAIKDKVQYYGLSLGFKFSGDFSSDAKSTLFKMTNPTTKLIELKNKLEEVNKEIKNCSDSEKLKELKVKLEKANKKASDLKKEIDNCADKGKEIIFNGNVSNITIDFLVGNDGKSSFNTGDIQSTTAIKINQTFVDATTQISKIFCEWTVDTVQELPKASDKYSDYDKDGKIKKQVITNGYFANINKIYSILVPKWNDSVITITNPESGFNLNPNEKNGYFNLNFKLEYDLSKGFPDIKTTSKFEISAENIHIILREVK
ncbi:hypothetical protein [Spiroplasma ixodetis]|uniref:hypothetical protein n=1 Tax=Spiroplasma ixodetis TaxID=2141 RepID=UPI00257652F2|nr:hypothetical protein [Spiroplasma ixodetis]WJG71131.1 hypothetical protein SIXOD_v1c24780 [Spiroplasma ixodetis Y32]